jgi:hypothetical protein
MGRGDVAHVEGWVLAQPDDVDVGKVQIDGIAQMRVIAPHALHASTAAPAQRPALPERQMIGRVMPHAAAARLRLFGQPERAVGIDVDGPDRIHLERNFHDLSPAPGPALKMARPKAERNG